MVYEGYAQLAPSILDADYSELMEGEKVGNIIG